MLAKRGPAIDILIQTARYIYIYIYIHAKMEGSFLSLKCSLPCEPEGEQHRDPFLDVDSILTQ